MAQKEPVYLGQHPSPRKPNHRGNFDVAADGALLSENAARLDFGIQNTGATAFYVVTGDAYSGYTKVLLAAGDPASDPPTAGSAHRDSVYKGEVKIEKVSESDTIKFTWFEDSL